MFWTWLTFSNKIIFFVFRKDALRVWSNIFETFRFAPKKISRWNNSFVFFSTTDVFVPVSQLSTRDLFDFLENLEIKQDMFLSWISRQVRSVEQRALWFPYSRLSFWNSFQENVNSWVFGVFYKVNCGVHLGFWHISFRKMFELLTRKQSHDF